MKKTVIALLACTLLAGFANSSMAADEERSHILKIYNWADYIDEDLLGEFEDWYKEQTGEEIKVLYQLFDINEVMLTKIETGHEDYDVVCPSEYIIERMLRNDLLHPISHNFGNTPDYTINVAPFFRNLTDEFSAADRHGHDYVVPYMWGTTGLLYNPQYVTDEEASTWGTVWNPKYAGKILMKDAFRDVYGSLMMYIRKDEIAAGTATRQQVMNDLSDDNLKIFEDTLAAAMENISGWEVDFGKERMSQGKDWINVTWSGDAMWAIEECSDEVELRYRVPMEGSNIWFDGWVIPKYARNPKAASYFINFMCISENAMRNMDAIGYVSAIGTPEILEAKTDAKYAPVDLSYFFGPEADSVCVNDIQYPDAGTIGRCALMHDSGDRAEAMIDMWSRVKGDSLSASTLIIIGIVVIAILVGVILSRKKKRSRRPTRR